MKSIQTILVMCLLKGVLQATPVTADGPTSISGYVTDDSTEDPIDDVELAFENLRTEETVYAQTNQYGYYSLFKYPAACCGWDEDIRSHRQ